MRKAGFTVSIRAPLARGDETAANPSSLQLVSIRAPLARGDPLRHQHRGQRGVSIRAPLARGDSSTGRRPARQAVSIRAPLARGDQLPGGDIRLHQSFNPRPSCEGRLDNRVIVNDGKQFQSAPLLRGATVTATPPTEIPVFQSAPLLRGATLHLRLHLVPCLVSIRAPLARGDSLLAASNPQQGRFNPRPSCEGRL